LKAKKSIAEEKQIVKRCSFVFRQLLLTVVALHCAAFPAEAQSIYATLTGNITDASGVVVKDARIEIANDNTGATRTVTSNAEGIYSVPHLDAGTYTLRASAPGSAFVERKSVALLARDSFGQITATQRAEPAGPRVIQMTLRFLF
jgi:hypothetical protein